MLNEEVLNKFYKNETIAKKLPIIISQIMNNEITPVVGVKKMIDID
jgi:hypothetical protein